MEEKMVAGFVCAWTAHAACVRDVASGRPLAEFTFLQPVACAAAERVCTTAAIEYALATHVSTPSLAERQCVAQHAADDDEFCMVCGLARAATMHAPGAKRYHDFQQSDA